MSNSKYSLVNGKVMSAVDASVLITDLGIQRGYGVFDFFKTLQGKPVFLSDHLDRLYNSLAALRLPFKYTRVQLINLLNELLDANNLADSGVRITVTGGYSPDGFSIAEDSNLLVTQQPLTVATTGTGIRLMTHEHQRQLSHVKSLDYMMAIWLQTQIAAKKAHDVLYHLDGVVTECPRANFFIVTHDDEILTPAENILQGIIRKQLLKMSSDFDIRESRITVNDIRNARECFITSTTKNVLPVLQIDDHQIGDGRPGVTTQKLQASLQQMISEHLETTSAQHA